MLGVSHPSALLKHETQMPPRKKIDVSATPADARACPAVHVVLSPRVGELRITLSLEDIEQAARNLGCELLHGPQKVKLVRVLYTYHPCPQAGPGMWECASGDDLLTAALEAWVEDVTPNMLRVIRPSELRKQPAQGSLG
jgi:hypothetical protein